MTSRQVWINTSSLQMFKMFAFGFETRTTMVLLLINHLINKALLTEDNG